MSLRTIVFWFVATTQTAGAHASTIWQCAAHLELPVSVMPKLGESRRLEVEVFIGSSR